MSTRVQVVIRVDDDSADPDHPTGLSERAFLDLTDAIIATVGELEGDPIKLAD